MFTELLVNLGRVEHSQSARQWSDVVLSGKQPVLHRGLDRQALVAPCGRFGLGLRSDRRRPDGFFNPFLVPGLRDERAYERRQVDEAWTELGADGDIAFRSMHLRDAIDRGWSPRDAAGPRLRSPPRGGARTLSSPQGLARRGPSVPDHRPPG